MKTDEPNHDPLLEQAIVSEKKFRDKVHPDPRVQENLRRRLKVPLPLWKKPVPAWAAAAAVILVLLLPAYLFLNANPVTTTVVQERIVHDTLLVRDTVTLQAPQQEQSSPVPQPVKRNLPRHRPIASAGTANPVAAAVLGVQPLPMKLPVNGFTMADDTSLKKFVVGM